MNIIIKPLSLELINNYLSFFDSMVFDENPDWSACYCYSFHFTGTPEEWNKEDNRKAVTQLIQESKMKGYLAFSDGKPVGWCNVNDRNNYQRLKQHYDVEMKPEDKVCSIVCFVISPKYRRKGIARMILEQIIVDYTAKDYNYIEAYPAKEELSNERNYKGPISLYEKQGFKIIQEFDNYYIVRKSLN